MKQAILSWLKSKIYTANTIRYKVEYDRLVDCLKPHAPVGKVFDGGAATGEMVKKLLLEGWIKEATAFEYDEELVTRLRENLGRDSRVQIMQGSLVEVPLESESFDMAMSTQVLEHIEDDVKAAGELGRLVKKGGLVLVSVPFPPERIPNDGHLREGYTEEDLVRLFPASQYELLRTEYSLTLATQKRMIAAAELPFRGKFLPISWVDRESHLTSLERKNGDPYIITCLFRKLI